jgi:UDP-N-acetylmuramyl tripeptide synthase
MFPSDDDMRSAGGPDAEADHEAELAPRPAADVELTSFEANRVRLTVGGEAVETTVELYGVYNMYNAAAALALALAVAGPDADRAALVDELSRVTPAFGRGETITVDGRPLQLLLVKNPAGFRLSLASARPGDYATMIAINDEYADGRDVSWLWDVDFHSLRPGGVDVVAGTRAWDMALRLDYDEVAVREVVPGLGDALQRFVAGAGDRPMRVFCTYTSMLELRRELSRVAEVAEI